ncbi:DUF1800 domain-containing protein [Sphingomonas sp.]|uniref:DUF1800 domain-containing protein n=1 Tax=Sphingomonas sp. TaxID=28214 RepID=UPI003B000B54
MLDGSDVAQAAETIGEGAVVPGGVSLSPFAVTASALALAACGGGGGDTTGGGGATSGGGTVSPPVVVVAAPPTDAQAGRFLAQATMGATTDSIAAVSAKGYATWLDEQLAMPRAISHWDWLTANGYNIAANINNETGFDTTIWRQLIAEPDQVRQRVGTALLDMLVVGIGGVNLNWKQFAMAAYVDVLLDNAFGNYRQILDGITYNAAMASWLTFMGNRKANATTGANPDENYARELMQLFSLGLQQLNMDGSVKTSGGVALETYTTADVTGLARVFTGLNLASADATTPARYKLPLVMTASQHETGTSTFLGTSVSGEGTAAIKAALDTIFAHANLPPFVSKQLIQRLVTSNPSPAYVGRVAATFADNGKGVRGDMKAVVKAILLDTEARSDAALTSAGGGKLRAPVLRLTGWARAFGVTSPSNAWSIGDTSSTTSRLGQSPGRSQTVFNFFRPGYSPPSTAISAAGMVAPEFQITNEQTVVAYVNYMNGLIVNGAGDAKADYTTALAKAADAAALVDWANMLLAAGQLSAATVASIRTAVESIAATTTSGPQNRVNAAILLTLASPDYLTVK